MEQFDLDKPILEFTGNSSGYWRIRHACTGVAIFGNTGSGKTSGSGHLLAQKYLSHGFGGLVLCCKEDERNLWINYCRLAKRENDLMIIEPSGQYYMNLLQYEISKAKGNPTDSIVEVLKTVIKAGEEKKGKSDDPFWEEALDMLLYNTIDLCFLAYGEVSIQSLYDIVQSIPKPDDSDEDNEDGNAFNKAFQQARENVSSKAEVWFASLSLQETIRMKNAGVFEIEREKTVPEIRIYNFVEQFFNKGFKNLSDKTRSIIELTFNNFLFRFLREPIYSLFCNKESNFSPEDSLMGKILIINLPLKQYHKTGHMTQTLFKYIWQRAMEKRSIKQNSRPVFLWADEAQNFLHPMDTEFQATARSSRVATVYISQNLPNYNANMGGDKYRDKVSSFLSTLATKVFHSNTDLETNRYASDLIGEDYFEEYTTGHTIADKVSNTSGKSWKLRKIVRPEELIRLKTGGPNNNFFVEGYFHIQGDDVFIKENHIKMRFNQNYKS
ncbi:type IV secretory system conjugative DNA transfer family protein [Emticicia fontis]